MLYSEIKERSNRFIIALKIGFPFIILIILYLFLIKFYDFQKDMILLGILSICYVYYIFYLIYRGFQSTLIDNITKTFNRKYMLDSIKKSKKGSVIMLKITNIHDINDRYGVIFADRILVKFVQELSKFLESKQYGKVPIGRHSGGHFLLLLDDSETTLKHNFNLFKNTLSNDGIDGVEVKINFALSSVNYDKNVKNIITHLFNQFDYEDDDELLKPDAYDKLICKSIDNKDFIFLYQPILDLKDKKVTMYDLLVKLHVKEFGTFTSIQLRQIINRNGYEKEYEIKMLEALLSELNGSDITQKIILDISSVVLRNNTFMNFIKDKINSKQINPKRFIISIYDKKSYEEIVRFKEILQTYKDLGFEILLDRYGGNNASLEYIKWFPVDYVSFDLEFTKYYKKGNHTQILVAYITLLKSLHVKTIAKFVETPYMYESLKAEGIDYLQGYMIGKPKMMKKIKNDNS